MSKSLKSMSDVMNQINMIAEEYRILSDQLSYDVIKTYSEFENCEEMTQEQILSKAIDETDNIMFHVKDTNSDDFQFSEKEIEAIESVIIKSSLDQGILIEQIKSIKIKQNELENSLPYKKF